MPSSPRKRAKSRTKPQQDVRDEDSDTDSSMPPLVDSSDSDDESKEGRLHPRKAVSNAESVEMWLDLSKASRERHIKVMKIYLLSPFLFDIVEQEDKWINWAHECHLLPTKKNIDPSLHIQELMEAVNVVEDAFNNVTKYLLAKEDSDETEKALGMMDKINTMDKLDKAIMCAESFTTFLKIRENIKTAHFKRKGDGKRRGDTSLLLALQQMYDHIRKLTRENKDLTKQYEEMCRQGELQSVDMKKKGNTHFMDGKYKAAISAYSKAILMSQYSYILYGNRAQSYLRTKEKWQALFDGRRSVVLKPEWTKGQYRYAQAYFDLGEIDLAVATNREAKRICIKDSRDLDIQYERFLKEKDIQARKNAKTEQHKHQSKINNIDDLPGLVDADTDDTSGDSSDDDDDYDCYDDMISSSDDSDSELEQRMPELVTDSSQDSDSDDAKPQRKIQNTQKANKVLPSWPQPNQTKETEQPEVKKKRKEKEKNKPEQSRRKEAESSDGPQKRRDLTFTLKQGSKAYLDGKVKAAVRYYGEAFDMLSLENALEMFKIKSIDFILILYAHGTACLETSLHKELLEATKQFETIIVKYKDIKFPLAFFGLGRVYHRQNKFSEALVPLNQGFNMVKSGEEIGEYRWPGTQTIIEETKPGKLKVAFENIISLCQHPPRPDAICRYTECSNGRTNIYLTDPDYKGYIRLICDESCKIDYHPTCWKKYKSSYGDKNADKDYLEDVCMTPDCGLPVVRVQIYGADGLKTEFASEINKVKQKQKQNKGKPHGNQKPIKTEKQRKEKDETKVDNAKKDITESDTKDSAPANNKNKPKPAEAPEEKELDKAQITEPKTATIDPRVDDTGVYILRKNEDTLYDEMGFNKGGKGKSKKKKVKNVQRLDEFLKDGCGQPFKPAFTTLEEEEKPEGPTFQWPEIQTNSPFAVPPHLQSEVQALEREYNATFEQRPIPPFTANKDMLPTNEKPTLDTIEDYMYSLFKETLNAHGPLDVDDARLVEPIAYLPESHQKIIHEYGGLKNFLMKSEQFVVQGNVVMLPDELHFQEIVKNVNRYLSSNKTSIKNLNGSAMEYETHGNDGLEPFQGNSIVVPSETNLRKSPLNPEVKEFIPASSSSESVCVEDSSPNRDFLRENVTIASEEIDVGEEYELLVPPHSEEMTIEPRSENLLKRLIRTAQTKSPWGDRKKEVLDSHKFLSGNGSELLSQCDVFRMPSYESIKEPKTQTVGTNTPHEGNVRDNLSEKLNGKVEELESKNAIDNGTEGTATLSTPTKHMRAESSGSENTIGYKSKGVQTQLQVKAKGIMTDALSEPFKVEYLKASQEKEDLQRKFQDVNEKLINIQSRHNQELEKLRKKYIDSNIEREKLQKEVQFCKQEGLLELKKLGEACEEKVKLVNSLEEHFKLERDRYQTTITGLQSELTAAKTEMDNEKAKFNSSLAQKEELIKKANVLKQQQETRAQESEVKLLELRRDVGLRFLERALQEAHVTVTHLTEALKTSRNTISITKLDDLLSIWKSYANDCHQKIIQCKTSFNAQIKELKSGRSLSSLPQIPIPGPAPFPAPPILQPLNLHPQVQLQLQNHPKPTPDVHMNPISNFAPHPTSQMPVVIPQSHTVLPVTPAVMPQQRLQQQHKGHVVTTPVHQVAQSVPEGTSSTGAKPDGENKSRPSNSFEKIMLRLSTMYPFLARADLTGLIKEVRQNKRGTLTGLSLEEIVKSVSDLVEAKVKVGIIRLPTGQTTLPPRSTTPQSRTVQSNQTTTGLGMNGATKNTSPTPPVTSIADSKPCGNFELDEDDPCVICHDDMKSPIDTVTLECGHKYHNACIRKWLMGEQSTCPTCRVHALLPDEFPRLK